MHAVVNLANIEIIDHTFLESDHTQMECESMHSAIEFAKKKIEIYIPSQWATIIRMARKNPYYVVPLQYEDIYDFKEVNKSTLKYSKVDSEGIKVNWMKIKWLRFSKNDAEHVLFKHKFDEDFKKMKVVEVDKKGMPTTSLRGKELQRKYKAKQTISLAKKKDLLSLCKTRVIPMEYHDFYKGLPANAKVNDTLPSPNAEENEQDSDK